MGNFKAIWMSFKICTIFILIALIKLIFSGYAVHIFLHNFCFTFIDQTVIKYLLLFVFVSLNWNCTWLGSDAEENEKQMKCLYVLRVPLCQVNFHHLSFADLPAAFDFVFIFLLFYLLTANFSIQYLWYFMICHSIAISKIQIAFHKQLNSLV